jgi:hypothetical protein
MNALYERIHHNQTKFQKFGITHVTQALEEYQTAKL